MLYLLSWLTFFSPSSNRTSFLNNAKRRVGLGAGKVSMSAEEQKRFGAAQAGQAGATLARNPSRPQ